MSIEQIIIVIIMILGMMIIIIIIVIIVISTIAGLDLSALAGSVPMLRISVIISVIAPISV